MNEKTSFKELLPEQIRWICPETGFKFETTKELSPLDAIVGQNRAIEALRIGAELKSKGYNIFVSGLSGTGRLSTVSAILKEVSTSKPIVFDYCYVNNFSNQDFPVLLKLEAGRGKELEKLMNDAVTYLRNRIPKLFEEEAFQSTRKTIVDEYQNKERQILHDFDAKILPFGFVRGQFENDQGINTPEVFPLIDGEAVSIETLPELIAQGKIESKKADELNDLFQKFHNELFDLARQGMKLMQEFKKALDDNDQASAAVIIHSLLDEIKTKFADEKVDLYIDDVKKYALENIGIFAPDQTHPSPLKQSTTDADATVTDKFALFSVNVILDNSETQSAPIVIETNPSYTNLFGSIERTYDSRGFWVTDFSKIKAGAILKADQGFLIVNADDLFVEQGVWQALKRVLLYDKLEIQPYESFFQLSQLHMKPESIDVNVKVVIIGGITLYKLLFEYEKGFKKIFKVNAQFDYETNLTAEMLENYTKFISKICESEQLPHCTTDGAAAIIEWAVEKAGSQKKITLKFSDVADLIREAAFYDRNSSRQFINREDVNKAIEMRRHRNDMLDDKLKSYILDGVMLIDTEGERVGQINGLTILDDGLMSFGKPARITASVSAGTSGIINIEREVEMSGAIHSKGVFIISAFIREKFAQDKPLNLTASLAFEQSYGGIDGDSASAAEIFVLMSALSKVPINQYLAITGSVNQKGDIQPIGGVNEKITGFFEICRERGFNRKHGVVIPFQNVKDLMLNEEIVQEVRNGNFHIYSIAKIEEGFELLMNLQGGERNKSGKYPKDSVFRKVEDRLEELRIAIKGKDKTAKKTSKKKSNKLK